MDLPFQIKAATLWWVSWSSLVTVESLQNHSNSSSPFFALLLSLSYFYSQHFWQQRCWVFSNTPSLILLHQLAALKSNWILTLPTWNWSWSSSTLATWCEYLTYWKRSWCWARLKAEGEEGDRGWDGWMVSPIQCTWTWANSGRWWGTGRPGVLQSVGSQRAGRDLATEQQPPCGIRIRGHELRTHSHTTAPLQMPVFSPRVSQMLLINWL